MNNTSGGPGTQKGGSLLGQKDRQVMQYTKISTMSAGHWTRCVLAEKSKLNTCVIIQMLFISMYYLRIHYYNLKSAGSGSGCTQSLFVIFCPSLYVTAAHRLFQWRRNGDRWRRKCIYSEFYLRHLNVSVIHKQRWWEDLCWQIVQQFCFSMHNCKEFKDFPWGS